MKELNVRTGNNEYKFLLELFGSGLEVKKIYFAQGQQCRPMAQAQLC